MRKILTVVGARPQFIKSAALSFRLNSEFSHCFREICVHTGQHYDYEMSELFFEQLNIPRPHYELSLRSKSPAERMSEMLREINAIIEIEKPDCLLVFGDTDSTLAGALAADFNQIPVAHVEAGLRSFRHNMPEERNRKLTDHISRWLFVPGKEEVQQLITEGMVPQELKAEQGQSHRNIQVVGDIMLDTLKMFQPVLSTNQRINSEIPEAYILLTLHRNFNTDDPDRLRNIFKGLSNLAAALNVSVIFPVHPRTSNALREAAIAMPDQIKLLSPQGYLQTQQLIQNCGLVITDSGGLQKEAYFHGKYGLILRDTTEWKNLLKHSFSVCVDDNPIAIETEGCRLFGKTLNSPAPLFGDGTTAKQILDFLEKDLN